jgi:8-oxo-dGTP diphosphatase
MHDPLHVAIALIQNQSSDILIQQRPETVHMAGLWEFPGGKVELHESPKMALRRELREELGIELIAARFFFNFDYQYPELLIRFHVFAVERYDRIPTSHEGQLLRWQAVADLSLATMPPANQTILQALCLETRYMIADHDLLADRLEQQLEVQLANGIRLVQLRAQALSKQHYFDLLASVRQLAALKQARVILNCPLDWLEPEQWPQLHLSTKQLRFAYARYKAGERHHFFSASVHNDEELMMANTLSLDCVLLAPVLKTPTHSEREPLAWAGFQYLLNKSNCPAFALGGMTDDQLIVAQAHGGHGIAGIRLFAD